MERVYGEALKELSGEPFAAHTLREADFPADPEDSHDYKKAG
jgi:hypothetical protein